MLNKNTTTTDKYKVNHNAQVTVKNVRVETEQGRTYYRTEVTLKHKLIEDDPLTFGSSNEIAEFIAKINMEDPQMELPIMEANKDE